MLISRDIMCLNDSFYSDLSERIITRTPVNYKTLVITLHTPQFLLQTPDNYTPVIDSFPQMIYNT